MNTTSDRELDTILAALRFWQARNVPRPSPSRRAAEEIIAKEHGPALDDEEIDALCQRLGQPAQPDPRFVQLVRHCLDTLNSSDAEHAQFMDSGADSIQLFWDQEHQIKALAREFGLHKDGSAEPMPGEHQQAVRILASRPGAPGFNWKQLDEQRLRLVKVLFAEKLTKADVKKLEGLLYGLDWLTDLALDAGLFQRKAPKGGA